MKVSTIQQYAQYWTPYTFQFVHSQMDLLDAIKTENVQENLETPLK